jgi:hypothetical protein
VTRSGVFSPFRRLFTLGIFLILTKVPQICRLPFSAERSYLRTKLAKIWVGVSFVIFLQSTWSPWPFGQFVKKHLRGDSLSIHKVDKKVQLYLFAKLLRHFLSLLVSIKK